MIRRRRNKTKAVRPKAVREIVAKLASDPYSLFFPAKQFAISGTARPRSFSFRAAPSVSQFIEKIMKEGFSPTDAINHAAAFSRAVVDEAMPYALAFSFVANEKECTPAQAIVRLAIERLLEEYPEQARAYEPRKK